MKNKVKLYQSAYLVVKYLKNKSDFIKNEYFARIYGSHGGITVKECIDVLGTTELRKIMSDLRKKGFVVRDIWEEGENRFGEKTKYKRYFLNGKLGRTSSNGKEKTL